VARNISVAKENTSCHSCVKFTLMHYTEVYFEHFGLFTAVMIKKSPSSCFRFNSLGLQTNGFGSVKHSCD
jgi:hypothetical protein